MTQLKIIPGEMRNINPNEISLVKKGANGISAVIAKADEAEEPVQITKEEKGFLQTLRNLFNVEKSDKVTQKTQLFAARMAIADTMDKMWAITDTLRATLRDIIVNPDVTEKKAAWDQTVDEFSAYLKEKGKDIGKVEVAKELGKYIEEQPIEKAGKSISAANMKKIQDALDALKGIITIEEEVEKVKKEDYASIIEKSMKTALEPVIQRLEILEKGGNTEEVEKSEEEKFADMIAGAITKAFEPLEERIDRIEKTRAGSKQLEEEQVNVQKSTDGWGIKGIL